MTAPVFQFKPESANSLVEEVMERSGQKLTACYQCRRCAAGCPVGEETGYVTPDRLIRMIAMGDRDNAFNNELVWRCVSCYTCGTRCPNEIQTSRITETLKKMGQESYIKPLRHKVAYFHKSFINAGIRWNSWKKAAARTSTSAKSVEVRICKNCFLVFPLGKAVRETIFVQRAHVPYLRKDIL